MAISVSSAARFVCELGDWKVTNLQLQKILYISHMIYMGKRNGERLVDASFEAWDFGPVIPSLYKIAKAYGSKPIRTGFYDAIDISELREGIELNKVCKTLLKTPSWKLVDFTHRVGGAWDKNYIPNMKGIDIPDRDILQEYRKIFAIEKRDL